MKQRSKHNNLIRKSLVQVGGLSDGLRRNLILKGVEYVLEFIGQRDAELNQGSKQSRGRLCFSVCEACCVVMVMAVW